MIIYYQLNKIQKKSGGGPKIRSKWSKIRKTGKKLVKNWYYVHYETKNTE